MAVELSIWKMQHLCCATLGTASTSTLTCNMHHIPFANQTSFLVLSFSRCTGIRCKTSACTYHFANISSQARFFSISCLCTTNTRFLPTTTSTISSLGIMRPMRAPIRWTFGVMARCHNKLRLSLSRQLTRMGPATIVV